MCCEQLVCASCAGMVVDARCPSCRSSKAHVHAVGTPMSGAQLLVAIAFVVLALALLGSR